MLDLIRSWFYRAADDRSSELHLKRVWKSALRWVNGDYRRDPDPVNDPFNIEPNSLAFAAVAELFDYAVSEAANIPEEDLADCFALRAVFASCLEPYFDVYRSPGSLPRMVEKYKSTNYSPSRSRNPRWTNSMLRSLRHRYMQRRAHLPDLRGQRWLYDRWGHTLATGLRDEASVYLLSKRPE